MNIGDQARALVGASLADDQIAWQETWKRVEKAGRVNELAAELCGLAAAGFLSYARHLDVDPNELFSKFRLFADLADTMKGHDQ